MHWTDKQLNDAEEAVIKLVEATGLSEAEVVEILSSGFSLEYRGKIPYEFKVLIDELRATFDVY